MFYLHLMKPIVVFGLIAATVDAQTPPGRDYKVAFWYEMDRPFSSAQYRAYDLAKGEYDARVVDRWLNTIFADHPRYGAKVRDLSTVGEAGTTEAERLRNAVEREKRRWGTSNSRQARAIPKVVGPPPLPRLKKEAEVKRTNFDRSYPGESGLPAYPRPSPFPYPDRPRPF